MKILKIEKDGKICLKIIGRLDAIGAPEFEKILMPYIEECPEEIPLLDFSDMRYISSSGLRILMKAIKLLNEKDERLSISGLRPEVFTIFKISGFTDLIDIP
jgi:anti-anti-sigma factor